jgi:signal transduction histidine kinase
MEARRESELLAYLSHELRTGLNAIVGHAQLLRLSDLSADDTKSVDRMVDAGFYLVGILDEVAELAGDELRSAGRDPREPVELKPLLQQLCELLGPLAGAQGVTIEVEPTDAVVMASRRRLTQILLNLLSNAIKYGGARVALSTARIGDQVELSVADAGPGIDSDRMRDLFEPFERLGAESGPKPGSGIGLALSQRIARQAGATLSVASEPGQGATFTIGLDAATERDSASA